MAGTLYSGTSTVETEKITTVAEDQAADIIWFNGIEDKTENNVTITEFADKDQTKALVQNSAHNELIPTVPDTSHRFGFKLSTITSMPIEITNENGNVITIGGESYDGTCYELGDGWYMAYIPNGLTKFGIKIGNTIFLHQDQPVSNAEQ
jgi:hypothetical protein